MRRPGIVIALVSVAAAALALSACSSGDRSSARAPSAAQGGVSSAYLVSTRADSWPAEQLPLVLKPIDASTGQDLPGYEPEVLGHHGRVVVSPDGLVAAISYASGSSGNEYLRLFDLENWKPLRDLKFDAHSMQPYWTPDGKRLIVVAERGEPRDCTNGCAPMVDYELLSIDPRDGDVLSRHSLPFGGRQHISPDGKTLYLFGNESISPPPVPARPPTLLAVDVASGEVRQQMELPAIRFGQQLEPDVGYVTYYPGTAMSPDGTTFYVFHPDSEQVSVIDLQSFQVSRTHEIKRSRSLLNRFFSLFVDVAHAEDGEVRGASALLSPDGGSFYRVTSREPTADEKATASRGVPNTDAMQVIDSGSLDIVEEHTLPYDFAYGYRQLSFSSDGRYLYAFYLAELVVIDTHTWEIIGRRPSYPIGSIVVAPPPPSVLPQ